MSHSTILGIDVAAKTLECCLLLHGRRYRKSVANTPAGCQQLVRWVQQLTDTPVPLIVEATGGYEELVLTQWTDQGGTAYQVNPYRIKKWAESQLIRTKTDRVDAYVIARFGQDAEKLHAWAPVAPPYRELQGLDRTRRVLKTEIRAMRNRAGAPGIHPNVYALYQQVLGDLTQRLKELEAQIRTLIQQTPEIHCRYQWLCSITGIGPDTAVLLLAEIGDGRQFQRGKQLVAYAGLSIQLMESGTSVQKKPRITKRGVAVLRAGLYFPAMTALRWDPSLQALGTRLTARGKTKKQILCAVMRKLLERAFAVLRTELPYDPAYLHPRLRSDAVTRTA